MSRPPRQPHPPPGTLVLFIRHGRTATTGIVLPGRAKGLDLSEQGHRQAQAVAERLVQSLNVVDAVYSSPLERAKQTAAPIAKAFGHKVSIHKGLLECDFGEWTGTKLKELQKLPEWQQVQQSPGTFRFPNGESFLEMQARMGDAVSSLVAAHAGGVIVAVSHADPIKTALSAAMGTPLDLFQRFHIDTCSVSMVRYSAPTATPLVLGVNTNGTFEGQRFAEQGIEK